MRGKSPSNVAMFLWSGNFKRGGRVATASVRERFQLGSAESIIASREDNKAKGGGGSNQVNVGSWDEGPGFQLPALSRPETVNLTPKISGTTSLLLFRVVVGGVSKWGK